MLASEYSISPPHRHPGECEDSGAVTTVSSPRGLLAGAHGGEFEGRLFADRYVIEERIGEGGMGCVYRGRHHRLGRSFAIKVLHGAFADSPKMRARFTHEAELAGRLDHPNLVSVVDFGESRSGRLYLVMEFIEGLSLAALLRQSGPLPAERVVTLMRQLSQGLAYAHEQGLVHRDLKPTNILISSAQGQDQAHIVDFGLAVSLDPDEVARITSSGCVMGTPRYMAPEQASGGAVDHRIDLFSLGLIMYEMLAGVHPFRGNPIDVVRQNLARTPPRIAKRRPGLVVEEMLEDIAFKLMAKDPAMRYQSAREVVSALESWQAPDDASSAGHSRASGRSRSVRPPSVPPERSYSDSTPQRSFARNLVLLAGATLLAMFAGAVLVMLKAPAEAPRWVASGWYESDSASVRNLTSRYIDSLERESTDRPTWPSLAGPGSARQYDRWAARPELDMMMSESVPIAYEPSEGIPVQNSYHGDTHVACSPSAGIAASGHHLGRGAASAEASDLQHLYAHVGEQLAELLAQPGRSASHTLREQYLHIPIADAFRIPALAADARRRLLSIQRDIQREMGR